MSLMDDTADLNEILLQWFSRSPTAREIDSEMGDLSGDVLVREPLLTYLRYDLRLDEEWLRDKLKMELSVKELRSLHEMDRPKNMDRLAELGGRAAHALVEDGHFPAAFDLLWSRRRRYDQRGGWSDA